MTGPCEFCGGDAPRRGGKEEGLAEDLFVCPQCVELLRNPATGLPLVRGNASLALRGVVPDADAGRMVNSLIDGLSSLKPRN